MRYFVFLLYILLNLCLGISPLGWIFDNNPKKMDKYDISIIFDNIVNFDKGIKIDIINNEWYEKIK
jgi:hypothetical protein